MFTSNFKSVLILLRFPFSLFLLPVYLLALHYVPFLEKYSALAVFFILHVLVYPSSNGYNSFIDKDTEPIGGVALPPPPPPILGPVTVVLDSIAVVSAFFVRPGFGVAVAFLVLMSRLYSAPWPRLKQYPVLSFLLVFLLQGAFTFLTVLYGMGASLAFLVQPQTISTAMVCSALIGSAYPLSQVFQHDEDAKRGDMTLSRLLGYRGTFIFSIGMLLVVIGALFFLETAFNFSIFLLCLLPAFCYLCYWALLVWKNETQANFKHGLVLNILWAVGLNLCFGIYILV